MLISEHGTTNCKELFLVKSISRMAVIETYINIVQTGDPLPNLHYFTVICN